MIQATLKSSRSHRQFLAPTLRSIAAALQQGLFAEELSRRAGLLQTVDPRVKIIALVELLLSIGLTHNAWIIVAVYAAGLVLAARSAVSPWMLLRRVWLAMPFFTIPLALPALVLTPGPSMAILPFGLIVTSAGAAAALFLLLRVSTSLTLALVLVYTTAWNDVLRALNSLGMPRTFALMLAMTQRYIDLLLRAAGDMLLSRESRLVGQLSTKDGQRLVGAAAGALLDKSIRLSGEVYLAMLSRGYTGAAFGLEHLDLTARDRLVLLAATAFSAAALLLGRYLSRGF
jgi:cobalt/nickel transport system permease protein